MKSEPHRTSQYGGSAPATPGFNAVAPEWLCYGAALAAPAVPAAELTLGSHPCVALSSAQVLPEWITSTSPVNFSALNGDKPLNFVSHSRGSLHNDRPVTTTSEHWESPQLQISVYSQSTSPQGTVTTITLKDLSVAEPDPSLLQVPPGYRVVDETGPFTVTIHSHS